MPGPDWHWQELPYEPDSSALMRRLARLPCPFFLDSGSQGSDRGRWDILTAAPLSTISLQEGVLNSPAPLPAQAGSSIWAAGQYLLDQLGIPASAPDQPDPDVPFRGGLCGCLGYPRLSPRREIQLDAAYLGVYPWALVVDHELATSRAWFQPWCPPATRRAVQNALEGDHEKIYEFSLLEPFSNDVSESDYRRAFERIKAYIQAGDCYQVNLTQRFSSRYQGQPLAAFLKLRRASGKPFSAFVQWDDKALVSLSPERFLRVQGNQVVTQPIKGTRPRGETPADDRRLAEELLASAKDRAENLMIVDLLRNDLGKLCEYGSIHADPLFELQSFDNVHHLVSTVSGRLKDSATPLRLLENCFPGGSITGAPKLRAMEIIEELELHQREFYCGSVFYLGQDGRMDSNITIRSLLCQAGRISCWAGGGIVADSDCGQEYKECFDKISRLINTLQS